MFRLAALFVAFGLADLALTLALGQSCEANPIAAALWGADGGWLAAFKVSALQSVVIVCMHVDRQRPRWARRILIFGCCAEGAAAAYGLILWLFYR